jgi:SAM-dependent methyltransferase
MNVARTIETLRNFWIDLMIQHTFLGGRIVSIDGSKVIYDTVSTGYSAVKLIFLKYYAVRENDVIVDVGCGKGRVFNYLLYRGFKNRMIGYEINTEVAEKTKRNLGSYKNVEIISENIFDRFPKDANLFYLFNPFNHTLMQEFKGHILEMKDKDPVILYYNPTCLHVFDDDRFVYELTDFSRLDLGVPHKLAIIRKVR